METCQLRGGALSTSEVTLSQKEMLPTLGTSHRSKGPDDRLLLPDFDQNADKRVLHDIFSFSFYN